MDKRTIIYIPALELQVSNVVGDSSTLLNTVLTHREVLESLLSAPMTKPELVDECDVSRSTIDRWLRELQESDLVHRPADRFELTLFGRLVTREQAQLQSRFDQLFDLRGPLMRLSNEANIDSEVFENAEIDSYTCGSLNLGQELLTDPGRVKLIASDIAPVYSLFLFNDPHPDLVLEVVLDSGLISQIKDYVLNQQMPLLAMQDVEVYEVEESPPFCLLLFEREESSIVYLIFGGVDTTVGVVKNAFPAAVAWGETTYRNYRDRAKERRWPDLSQQLDVLRKRPHLLTLIELMNGNVEHENDVMARRETAKGDGLGVKHNHLPELEEAGYIEWNREAGTVSKGPFFEEIKPLLELIETHANDLPPG